MRAFHLLLLVALSLPVLPGCTSPVTFVIPLAPRTDGGAEHDAGSGTGSIRIINSSTRCAFYAGLDGSDPTGVGPRSGLVSQNATKEFADVAAGTHVITFADFSSCHPVVSQCQGVTLLVGQVVEIHAGDAATFNEIDIQCP